MKFIGFYTKDTPYEQLANENLIASYERWNLSYDVKGIPDRKSWAENTAMKSKIIKEMLLKYKEPVVFLDADATIEKFPELFFQIPNNVDLAFHHFNWFGHWRNQWENKTRIELLSGTMYWGYNEKTLNLLDEWIVKVQEHIHKWEQKILEEIVYAKNNLNIMDLPAEYCCVIRQNNTIPNYIKEPVIIHWQASRQYKRWWQNQEGR